MKIKTFLFYHSLLLLGLYGLGMLFIRLHMTQLAYQFQDKKDYQRSLMEEQMRLRSDLNHELSPHRLSEFDFSPPTPDEVVLIP